MPTRARPEVAATSDVGPGPLAYPDAAGRPLTPRQTTPGADPAWPDWPEWPGRPAAAGCARDRGDHHLANQARLISGGARSAPMQSRRSMATAFTRKRTVLAGVDRETARAGEWPQSRSLAQAMHGGAHPAPRNAHCSTGVTLSHSRATPVGVSSTGAPVRAHMGDRRAACLIAASATLGVDTTVARVAEPFSDARVDVLIETVAGPVREATCFGPRPDPH